MGEIAGLATSLMWALSSLLFSSASKAIGSQNTNRIRLLFATVLMMLTHWIVFGQPLPLNAGLDHWFWLALSGIVGLALGDAFLFQAYVDLGPRLSTLLMSLAPVAATFLAWIFLGETLTLGELLGIAVAVGGVMWVVLERSGGEKRSTHDHRRYLLGILFGLGGMLGQAGGLTLSKRGLDADFPSLSAVLIRILVGMLAVWIAAAFTGKVKSTLQAVRNPQILRTTGVGSIIGPYSGIWLSLIAVQHTSVGIASTLMALTPIFMLPLSAWFLKEKITPRAVFGTLIALAGVAMIFLLP